MNKIENYLGISNHDIQIANNSQELKSYVASILYENDELQQENQRYKEIIDRAKTELEQGITFCQNDSQGLYDKCNIAINREQIMLDILKEVE